MNEVYVVKDRHGKALAYCSSEDASLNFMAEYVKKFKDFSIAGMLGFIVDCCQINPEVEIVLRIKTTKTYKHDCFDHLINETVAYVKKKDVAA